MNQVSVSGGGSAGASANDATTINPSGGGGGGNSASFVRLDTTTQGTWRNTYGADGDIINADSNNIPAYASVTMSGQGPFVWASPTGDVRALQTFAGNSRIASGWYAFSSMSFDINLTDGNTHQLALYCLDFDTTTRAERVDILDAQTNAVLDTRNVTGFNAGQYLVWNLHGHVIVRVTLTGGANAVVSGLFFSTPPSGSPSLSITKTHSGSFTQGQNGAAYTVTVSNVAGAAATSGTVAVTEIVPAGLTLVSMSGSGWSCGSGACTRSDTLLAGASYPPITVTVNVASNAPAAVTNQVSVSGGGSATTSASDPTTINASGGGGGNTAAFVRLDTSTQGTWHGNYGADGEVINADSTNLPAYASVTMSGQGSVVWANSTGDPRALQTFAGNTRIASGWYTFSNMSFDVNLTDGSTHQFALYCLDFDTTTRAERVDILDASTNAVLDTRTMSSFNGGQYLVWNLHGHVIVRVTLTGGANAVASGLFFR
jgi:uncharacterized repeat protein (TIGR01451 family)